MELNKYLAFSKQYYDELTKLASLDDLKHGKFGSGAKKEKLKYLLKKLFFLLRKVDELFSAKKGEMGGTPIMDRISDELRSFYNKELRPNSENIREIYLDISGMEVLKPALPEFKEADGGSQILDTLSWVLDSKRDEIESENLVESLSDRMSIDNAIGFINEPYFLPDYWLRNISLLRPILINRDIITVPTHIKDRLGEIFSAFRFGLWMSVISLSRSVAEYAVIDNAKRLDFDPTYEKKGEKRYNNFEFLIGQISEKIDALRAPLEIIRKCGNRILHPKKKVIEPYKIIKQDAESCVNMIIEVVEKLYVR